MSEMMTVPSFKSIADEVFSALPVRIHNAINNVAIFVEEFPDDDTLAGMNIASPYDLLGLYQGWPLPERGSQYAGSLPDVIRLYRQPILAYSRAQGEDVRHCIRHVLIHEIGHYFGFSDAEMQLIESRP